MNLKTHIIDRPIYLEKLRRFRDKQLVKVVTGIRRCGKSTLLELFRRSLRESGIAVDAIQCYNFEDLSIEALTDFRRLYAEVAGKLSADRMNYVFFDEIQLVPQFEKTVDSLLAKGNVDIYLTGSNAFLLSGELATLLSGRMLEIHLTPLSFREAFGDDGGAEDFRAYLGGTAFPYARQLESHSDVYDYLEGVYNTVILKDVVSRYGNPDANQLQRVARFLMGNIGNLVSIKKISDTMTGDGQKISTHTVDAYLEALSAAYLFYRVPRFDVKGKQLLKTGAKYYTADLGLRNLVLGERNADFGHALENVVYLELRRRGWRVFVGKEGAKEIDFIAQRDGRTAYFQVALTALDEDTRRRELASLEAVDDSFPKTLLTLDPLPYSTHKGIAILNAVDWLTGKE